LIAADNFGYSYEEAEAKHARERILKTLEESEQSRENLFSESLASDICVLWEHPTTKLCVERKNDIQVLDSGPYFLKKARQISQPDYLPSDEDVLRARSQTTGIITFKFQVKNSKTAGKFDFELIDVGGQRTERRKWIHCFEDVTAVLFIISLSDYNQTLFEDGTTNRMQESEKVFGEMLNNVFFRNTPFIVFFNKVDLFKEKIKTTPLTLAYRDYSGPQQYEEAYAFLRQKFLDHDNSPDRSCYDFSTTATDTNLVRNVIDSVQTIVINMILKDVGLG